MPTLDSLVNRPTNLGFNVVIKNAGITRAAWPHSLPHTIATHLLAKTDDFLLVQ